jgi:hypothetical protein
MGATANGTSIISIVDGAPLDGDVRGTDIETVGVEGKSRAVGDGVNDGVQYSDVRPLKDEVVRDGLGRLPVLPKTCGRLVSLRVSGTQHEAATHVPLVIWNRSKCGLLARPVASGVSALVSHQICP